MNIPLFKATSKSNWIIFVIFLAVLFMYLSIMISMYDPDDIEAITQMYELLPAGMIEAFGFDETATDLVSFIALYFYGFIVLMFPLIYCIILANRLIAAQVDRGSMAYLLASPNTRVKIVTTQALYMVISVTALLALNTAAGIAISEAMFPGEMDLPAFLDLNLVTIFLTLSISSICFFFSCLFNEAKFSLAFGAGIPVLFFIINMLRNIGDNYGWLKYLTLYTLFDPHAIVTGEQALVQTCLIFSGIALVLFGGGIFIFSRRNLYL